MDRFTDSFLSEVDGDKALRHRLRAEQILGRSLLSKHLAGQHDQSSHGNWAQGTHLGLTKGGHNLTPREMLELRKNPSDPLQNSVYMAEALLKENVMGKEHYNELKNQAPVGPKRSDFASHDDYTRAYKQYSKDYTSWQREQTKFIVTDLAKKSLNGTLSGVKKYITTVIDDPWFVEKFGDGKQLRSMLEIKSSNSMTLAGQYAFGVIVNRNTGREKTSSEFKIDTHSTFDEKTLLHEIAHYATAISEENPHAGHGVEFARNFVTLADHYWGAELGSQLHDLYVQEGVLSE
jgi:hypothetical protein